MTSTLIRKSRTDIMRIYRETRAGQDVYVLQVNSVADGDPSYVYSTRKGALTAMRNFEKNRYSGKPTTPWE